jgi:hypothetical protein
MQAGQELLHKLLPPPPSWVLSCLRVQGIETVRRDNCELVRKMVATSESLVCSSRVVPVVFAQCLDWL